MRKKTALKKKAEGRLAGLLDVPLDVVADVPRIVLSDNREVSIENYKSIESYEPEEIHLQNKQYRIIISGKNLQIVAITDDEILIKGTITSLSLV